MECACVPRLVREPTAAIWRALPVSLPGASGRAVGLLLRAQPSDAGSVVARDRLPDFIRDRATGVRAPPEGSEADDVLGARYRVERSAAAGTEIAQVIRG